MAEQKASGVTLESILLEDGLVTKERLQEICSRQVILFNVAKKLKDWKLVGLCLKIPLEKLRAIEFENDTEHQCMIDVLDTWYEREGNNATYWRLADAFHRHGHRDLIQSLCTCLSERDEESEKWSLHINEYWTPERITAAVPEPMPEHEPSLEPHDDKDQAEVKGTANRNM